MKNVWYKRPLRKTWIKETSEPLNNVQAFKLKLKLLKMGYEVKTTQARL